MAKNGSPYRGRVHAVLRGEGEESGPGSSSGTQLFHLGGSKASQVLVFTACDVLRIHASPVSMPTTEAPTLYCVSSVI